MQARDLDLAWAQSRGGGQGEPDDGVCMVLVSCTRAYSNSTHNS